MSNLVAVVGVSQTKCDGCVDLQYGGNGQSALWGPLFTQTHVHRHTLTLSVSLFLTVLHMHLFFFQMICSIDTPLSFLKVKTKDKWALSVKLCFIVSNKKPVNQRF